MATAKSLFTREFFWNHLFKTVATIVVAGLTYVGNSKIETLQANAQQQAADLKALQCTVAVFTAEEQLSAIEQGLIGQTLDDLRDLKAFPFSELGRVQQRLKPQLELCDDGKALSARLAAYGNGLSAYVTRHYDEAASQFRKIVPANSVSESLLGTALYRNAEALDAAKNPDATNMFSEAAAHLDQAKLLSVAELDASAKETAISRIACNALLVRKSDSYNREAIECLQKLIPRAPYDHNIYYNLAAVSARMGKFEDTLGHLSDCLQHYGANYIRRSDIELDHDFDVIRRDVVYGPKFRAIVERFPA